MSVGIVVINNRAEADMSWQTTSGIDEANRMVSWLKDHHIQAKAFNSLSAWEAWSKSASKLNEDK